MLEWEKQVEDIKPYVGMVYIITEKSTNKSYIGIKKYWKTIKYPPLKGKKNKRHKIVESDWKTYNSSNRLLSEKIEKNCDDYTKSILKNCVSVTEMKAWEAYLQLSYYLDGKWERLYNEMINLRIRIR